MGKSKEERLEEIYARIPEIGCKGLCQDCCGPLGMSRLERLRIIKAVGKAPRASQEAMACNMLTPEGECSCYAFRPALCRIWGTVPEMACPHGCRPEKWLTVGQVARIFADIREIGGEDILDPLCREISRRDPEIGLRIAEQMRLRYSRETGE